MSTTTIEEFLKAPTEERLRMIKNDATAAVLHDYLGPVAFGEYRSLATRLDTAHLGVGAPKNLIFVPGVMGSLLHSDTKGGVWWVDIRTRRHIDDLRLSADGSEDADPNNQVLPFSVDTSYEPFLSAVLEREDFGHVTFPYDWRKPLSFSAGRLAGLIRKTYETNGNNPVHLVAHSMGGLLVRAALMEHGKDLWSKTGRIVFVGTPHYGSPSIAGYLKNHLWGFDLMGLLGKYLSPETFRSMWGVVGMLPAPLGTYPGTRNGQGWKPDDPREAYPHPCANFDMYQAAAWKLTLSSGQQTALQRVLEGAAAFHRQMYESHQALDQQLRDRMLVIAGVGYKTLFRLAYRPGFFGLWEHTDKITSRVKGDEHREGDGRVPLASAALENVATRYVKGVHGGLTNIPQVYHDVFGWLNEDTIYLPDDVSGALAGHLSAGDDQSEAPHLDGTARQVPFTDDPGIWNELPVSDQEVDELDARLGRGQLPEFINVRLL
jgi:pimeloyl-ACP methyl ester carboxylesterase